LGSQRSIGKLKPETGNFLNILGYSSSFEKKISEFFKRSLEKMDLRLKILLTHCKDTSY